jgi:TetR/AcrR family transcriptional repressor of mexJK operon
LSEQHDVGTIHNLLADLDLPRVPQQARSRKKRDALLAAAVRLFEERGYDATTADDIAAAASVSIGTFYGYFRNKRQVFLTLFAESVDGLLKLNISSIDLSTDPRKTIRDTVHRALQRDKLSYCLRRAMAELMPRDPEIAAYNHQLNRVIYEQILEVAHRAAAGGLTWPDLKIEPTCWAITLMLDQVWHDDGVADMTDEQVHEQREALADLIYHALLRGPHPDG